MTFEAGQRSADDSAQEGANQILAGSALGRYFDLDRNLHSATVVQLNPLPDGVRTGVCHLGSGLNSEQPWKMVVDNCISPKVYDLEACQWIEMDDIGDCVIGTSVNECAVFVLRKGSKIFVTHIVSCTNRDIEDLMALKGAEYGDDSQIDLLIQGSPFNRGNVDPEKCPPGVKITWMPPIAFVDYIPKVEDVGNERTTNYSLHRVAVDKEGISAARCENHEINDLHFYPPKTTRKIIRARLQDVMQF